VIVDNVELIGSGNKNSAAGSPGGFPNANSKLYNSNSNSFTAPPAASFVVSVKKTHHHQKVQNYLKMMVFLFSTYLIRT